MKKLGTFLVLMLLLCSLTLSSCSAWEAVTDFFRRDVVDKVMRAMEKASSYQIEGELEMTVADEKNKTASVYGETRRIVRGDASDFYYYSREYIMGTHLPKVTVLEAYDDGNYFFSFSPRENAMSHCYYSPLGLKTFKEYMEEQSEGADGFSGYSSLTHNEGEDGTHEIILSGYRESVIEAINETYGFPYSEDGAKVSDIVITLTTDSGYRLLSSATEFIFTDDSSRGTQLVKYSDYGCAQEVEMDTENCTLLQDALSLPRTMKLLSQLYDKEKGDFTYALSGEMLYNSEVIGSVETNKDISFGTDDYGFCFDIATSSNAKGAVSSVKYSDGIFLVNGKENDLTYGNPKQAEEVARTMVMAEMTPVAFLPTWIESVSSYKGKWRTTCYDFTFQTLGADASALIEKIVAETPTEDGFSGVYILDGQKLTMHVEVKGDEIVAIEYRIEVERVRKKYQIGFDLEAKQFKATIRIEF